MRTKAVIRKKIEEVKGYKALLEKKMVEAPDEKARALIKSDLDHYGGMIAAYEDCLGVKKA